MEFIAHIQKGSGRGKGMGTPTLNLDLADVPKNLKEGIYVCRATINEQTSNAVMHYGPRPVHKDTKSCEIHILNATTNLTLTPQSQPQSLSVDVIAYLRPVLDFPSEAALIAQIADDIEKARGILLAYDAASEKADS